MTPVSLLSNLLDCQRVLAVTNCQAVKAVVSDLYRQFLADYQEADFVIFRCPTVAALGDDCDTTPFIVSLDSLQDADGWIACEYCGAACDRLLADGQWQSQQERDRLNMEKAR